MPMSGDPGTGLPAPGRHRRSTGSPPPGRRRRPGSPSRPATRPLLAMVGAGALAMTVLGTAGWATAQGLGGPAASPAAVLPDAAPTPLVPAAPPATAQPTPAAPANGETANPKLTLSECLRIACERQRVGRGQRRREYLDRERSAPAVQERDAHQQRRGGRTAEHDPQRTGTCTLPALRLSSIVASGTRLLPSGGGPPVGVAPEIASNTSSP